MKPKRIVSFRWFYWFLSNYYRKSFVVDGEEYKSMEHYFQSQKAASTLDQWRVAAAKTPDAAKHLGRCVIMKHNWDKIKDNVMYRGLKAKFSDPKLAQKLVKTGDAELVEGNTWHDNYWGVCVCEQCGGKGYNHLGKLLMKVRDELRNDTL